MPTIEQLSDQDINNIESLEDIDKLIEEGSYEAPEEGQAEEQTEDVENIETEIEAEAEVEVPEETEEEEETAPEVKAPEEGQAIADKTEPEQFLITDELLNSMNFSEEEARQLSKFKGQPLREALKSYAHAQKLIGKKKEELFNIDKQKEVIQPKPALKPEFEQQKDNLIREELKSKVRDIELPDNLDPNSEEFKTWARDLNYEKPHKFQEFLYEKAEAVKKVDEQVQTIQYLHDNYREVNKNYLNEGIKQVNTYLQSLDVDPSKFGLKELQSAEDNFDDMIAEIIMNKEGNGLAPDVIVSIYGTPVIDPEKFSTKLLKQKLPEIMKRTVAKARKEGHMKAVENKPAPSLSSAGTKGKAGKPLTSERIADMNDLNEIERTLEGIENGTIKF